LREDRIKGLERTAVDGVLKNAQGAFDLLLVDTPDPAGLAAIQQKNQGKSWQPARAEAWQEKHQRVF